MGEFQFTGGQFHILYKPSLIGKEGDNIQLDWDLTTPPALTEEQVKALGDMCIEINKKFKDVGVTTWVTQGYEGGA